jgi:hypothetical protein
MSDKTIDFAVRLYVNDKYGKAIGKNKYNNYIYNGTLDFARDGANYRKYLLDLSQANKQSLRSLSGDLVDWFTELVEGDGNFQVDIDDLLISRLRHYELGTKKKEFVKGFVLQNQKTNMLLVALSDNGIFIEEKLQLHARRTEAGGRKICNLFAANYDA